MRQCVPSGDDCLDNNTINNNDDIIITNTLSSSSLSKRLRTLILVGVLYGYAQLRILNSISRSLSLDDDRRAVLVEEIGSSFSNVSSSSVSDLHVETDGDQPNKTTTTLLQQKPVHHSTPEENETSDDDEEEPDNKTIAKEWSSSNNENTTTSPGVSYARSVTWDYDKWFHPDGRPKHTLANDRFMNANYYELAIEGHFRTHHQQQKQKLAPLELMQQYIERNGQEQLQKEWKHCQENTQRHADNGGGGNLARIQGSSACAALANRTFVVGRYSCPLETGNRMHVYMNHIMWAIVTNRTFLSAYWDLESCVAEQERTECPNLVNNQSDCDPILRVKDWVPRFDEWKHVFDLSSNPPVTMPWIRPQEQKLKITKLDQDNSSRLIRVERQSLITPALYLSKPRTRKKLLAKEENQQTAALLLEKGPYFAYGMLFESLFTLQPLAFQDPALIADPKIYQTWVLHSRHPGTKQSIGGDDAPEFRCMESVAHKIRPPCVVYVMSDQEKALQALPEMLREYNCVGICANHSRGTSFTGEHGAFAGLGYFQDLVLARNARHGFVAPYRRRRTGMGIRTSSAMIREAVEFRRVLEGKPNPELCTNPFYSVDFAHKVPLRHR